jgi:hypothetical protein
LNLLKRRRKKAKKLKMSLQNPKEKQDDDEIVFEAYLGGSANIFKNLIELCSQVAPIKKSDNSNKSIKQAFLKFTKNGIYINIDHQSDILINVALKAVRFGSYKYNFALPELNIGITLDIIKDLFKNVKKSEGVALCIRKKIGQTMPHEIFFSISSVDHDTSRGFVVKFKIVQNISINAMLDGQDLVEMKSNQFLGLCKEMGGSKKRIKVIVNNNAVVFSCNMVDIATRWLTFPIENRTENTYDGGAESTEYNFEKLCFLNYFKSEHIKTITKLATFDDTIKMSCVDDSIIFKSHITRCTPTKARHLPSEDIGTISISVKAEPRKDSDDEDDL